VGLANLRGADRETLPRQVDAIELARVADQGAIALAANVGKNPARDGLGLFEARHTRAEEPPE